MIQVVRLNPGHLNILQRDIAPVAHFTEQLSILVQIIWVIELLQDQ